MRSKLFIGVILVVILASLGLFQLASKKSETPGAKTSRPSLEFKELSREEYAKVKVEFLALLQTHDPKFVLSALRERIKTDTAVLRSCHSLVHEIGHAAYQKYGNFGEAMKYQDEICNSGYLHGIIEAHFVRSADLFSGLQTVCRPYPVGKYLSWECYHGVGHGVMYFTDNDVPIDLSLLT